MPRATALPTTVPNLPTRVSPRKRKRPVSSTDQNYDQDDSVKLQGAEASQAIGKEVGTVAKAVSTIKSTKKSVVLKATGNRAAPKSSSPSKQAKVVKPESAQEKPTTQTQQDNSITADSTTAPVEEAVVHDKATEPDKKVVRRRKTKEEKAAEAMPLAARSTGLKMYVGAHVSIAKGVENAVTNAVYIGGNAFALFLKSQRKWENPPLKVENRDAFRKACTDHKFDAMSHVVPHGSYLVNLATPDKDKAKQAYDAFVDDLHRCEALGIKYYNFHPGTTNQEPLDEAIGRIAANLNRALSETTSVIPLLENMAGRGSVIGSRFSDLRDIIAGVKPEFRSRVGVCIDTCHAFAAGYDLRTPAAYQKTMQELDDTVGLRYLKAMHINDSKAPFESHRDLHQNIGVGFLGLRAFHNVMNDVRLQNIPLVLETPCDRPDPADPKGKKTIDDKTIYAREIKLLEGLMGMDPNSAEFKALEQKLNEQGRVEREKMEISIAATEEKKRKKAEKDQRKISDLFGAKGASTKGRKKQSTSGSDSELSDTSDRT